MTQQNPSRKKKPIGVHVPELVKCDPYLKPYTDALRHRQEYAVLRELSFTDGKKSLSDIANGHLYYGLHKTQNGWVFREKAPNAKALYLYGDFSRWQIKEEFSLHSLGNGDWEIELPSYCLKHTMLYKIWMVWQHGADDRLPAYATRVVQDEKTKIYCAQVWDPPTTYSWKYKAPAKPAHPLIYEVHVGMSSEEEKISSYWEFKETVLPRIKQLGYNTIQMMAVQEHPYYGSFGYQVANFFAPSSRFGTPEELKELIDAAHHNGIAVILDVVHSHSVSNEKEGIGVFDGNDHLYFHTGEKGRHSVWNSRCFDYGKDVTVAFLLSNLKYWLQEFHFDGFRFDGVTSMCYWNHGLGVDFVNYSQYFDGNVDEDAVSYLTMANKLIKDINPQALSVAEDVSGMPGMAFPVEKGGIGFDFRMSMGIADFWMKTVKESPDEKWNVSEIYFRMTDKRTEEQTISYVECHDQAMVGDKTLIFRLIDKEMYYQMSVEAKNLMVDRGIALHKMIRLVTLTLASGGYLTFMGNEFGHPEWIDFPREGNGWSFSHARRQWSLADNQNLKYYGLNLFDRDMIHLVTKHDLLRTPPENLWHHEYDQVLAYMRGNCLFVYSFNPVKSFQDYEISCPAGRYKMVLNSDAACYNGFDNVDSGMTYETYQRENQARMKLYIPSRTCFVLQNIDLK